MQLGLHVSSSLNWRKQCEEVDKKFKANRVFTVLQHNIHASLPKVKESAYQTNVRPISYHKGSCDC